MALDCLNPRKCGNGIVAWTCPVCMVAYNYCSRLPAPFGNATGIEALSPLPFTQTALQYPSLGGI